MNVNDRKRLISEEAEIEDNPKKRPKIELKVTASQSGFQYEEARNCEHILPVRKPNRIQRAISKDRKIPTKTISKSKLKRMGKRVGVLKALLDAPVEIFCEIALYLHPMDLLNLSRVTRQLHDFLLSKRNRFLWTTSLSLAATDLPPCPEDLNEPQYVYLVFDTTCNACGAPNVKTVHYELRIRLCNECFELNVLPGNEIVDDSNAEHILDLVCLFFVPYFGQEYVYFSIWKEHLYYKPDLEDILEKYSILSAQEDDAEQIEYKKYRMELTESIINHANLMREWEKERESKKKLHLSQVIVVRKQSIITKLKDQGYTDKDWTFENSWESQYKDQWNSLIDQKRELC